MAEPEEKMWTSKHTFFIRTSRIKMPDHAALSVSHSLPPSPISSVPAMPVFVR